MLARAILILSCLFCTGAVASAQAPASTSASIGTGTDAAPSSAAVSAGDATEPVPARTASESLESAVPVDRNALLAPTPEPAPKRALENDALFTPAVVLIGTGAAALLASLFTGLGAHGIHNSLEADCKNNICSSDKAQRISSGKALAMVSTVLTGAGIAAAGVGTALLILAATHDDQPPQSNLGLAFRLTGGPTPLGLGAAASF